MFDPTLQAARHDLGVSVIELWTDYFALGGNLQPIDIDAYLAGITDVSDIDHDLITHALNERHLEQGGDHPLAYFGP
jgi:hypothetical protein